MKMKHDYQIPDGILTATDIPCTCIQLVAELLGDLSSPPASAADQDGG